MSHVDEGTLHAVLDGALDALPSAEAERVRAHLAACETCRARLDEERAVRDEAHAVLADAMPGAFDLVPLEELRTRARARGRRERRGGRMQRLAWAASVVVALGVGWMLRGASVPVLVQESPTRPAVEPDLVDPAAAAAPLDTPAPSAEPESKAASAPGAAASEPASPSVEPDSKPASRSAELEPKPAATPGTGTDVPTAAVPVDVTGFLDTLSFPRTAAEAREILTGARADAGAVPRPSKALDRTAVEILQRPAAPTEDLARRAQAPTEREAPRTEITSFAGRGGARMLVVPGLEVLSLTDLRGEGLEGALRVRQRLDGGDTLEIVHLPAGLDPSALPPVREGLTELVLARDGGWLVVRGAAARERLLELIRGMEGGR